VRSENWITSLWINVWYCSIKKGVLICSVLILNREVRLTNYRKLCSVTSIYKSASVLEYKLVSVTGAKTRSGGASVPSRRSSEGLTRLT
jgi:hypothetical protein